MKMILGKVVGGLCAMLMMAALLCGTSAECGVKVWANQTGDFYHLDQHCCGMQSAEQVTLEQMVAIGRPACPKCCPVGGIQVWCTQNGTYFHFDPHCCGMHNAKSVSCDQAFVAGKGPCPVCWAESNAVWCTAQGEYCHDDPQCSGMHNAQSVSPLTAAVMGKARCPVCMATNWGDEAAWQVQGVGAQR